MKFYFKFLPLIFLIVAMYVQQSNAQSVSSTDIQQTLNSDSKTENFLKRSMFIKVVLSSNKIFVGEPVMAMYKFYTALNGQAVVLKQPTFSGCSVNELNFDESPQTETVNGSTYTSFIVRKVQLTPVEAGTLSMGIATVSNHVELPDAHNAFITNKYDIPVSNAPTSVDVILLPEKNKPTDFYGITGVLSITATVTDKKIAVGENDHLIITVNGSGNLDAINKPVIVWPGETEHFDGTDSQHIDQTNFPISGNRIFDIPFIGKKEGRIEIPPVSFSYFNTNTKNYQTITTNAIDVRFTKALAKNDEYKNVVNYDVSNRKYLWIIAVIALTAGLIGFINYRRNKIQTQKNVVLAATVTTIPVFEPVVKFKFKTDFSRYWADLESIKQSKPFFAKAKELLMTAVAEFADTTHHSELFLLAEMKSKLKDEALCKNVFALTELCNEKMYAPFETETDLEFYFNEVKKAIEALQALS